MIDINNVKYKVILVPATGKQLNITDIVESAGWEENKGELAMRITLSLKNELYNGKSISTIAKPGCLVGIFADYGNKSEEVARGIIMTWAPATTNSKESLVLTCYDEVYYLQKSQDNIYYTSGTGTKSAIMKIFDNWKIPVDEYHGPNVKHGKLVYKSESLSDVILDILDDAVKKGASKYIIRSIKGKVSILPRGSNKIVYHFNADNTVSVKNTWSTTEMVTRVKVIGQEDDDGKTSVEAVVNGQTQYGIRQKIYTRPKDDSVDAAKTAAKEILEEKGDIKKTTTLEAPDIPYIRKGDLIHVKAGILNGYYYVLGIRHEAASAKMILDIESTEESTFKIKKEESKEFNKGDSVILNGAVYVDSYGNGKGMTFKNYKGKITIKVSISRKCPYHVDHIGWVYPNTITKA